MRQHVGKRVFRLHISKTALILLSILLLLAACSTESAKPGLGNAGEAGEAMLTGANDDQKGRLAADQSADDPASDLFPVTIIDGAGHEVTIEQAPETMIALIPSITETVFALGLGDLLIGVDDYSNYPDEALEIEKVGGLEINVEKVLSLLPDVMFVPIDHHNHQQEALNQFREAGISVVVIDTHAVTFEDVYDSIRLIGEVTGARDEAISMIEELQHRLEELKAQAEEVTTPQRVWVEISPRPDIYTAGSETIMNEMLIAINAENVAAEAGVIGWQALTEEEILRLAPDVIITTYGDYVEAPIDEVLSRPAWSEVPAVKDNRVIDVDSDPVSRPGPRVMDGVEALAEAIYPEIFGE